MSAIEINSNNFDREVLSSQEPVMLDFWAPWCGPCRMFSPIVDAVAAENAGKIKVGKVNIDEEPELAQKYGVMSIPTVVMFKNGRVLTTSVGSRPKQELDQLVKQAI